MLAVGTLGVARWYVNKYFVQRPRAEVIVATVTVDGGLEGSAANPLVDPATMSRALYPRLVSLGEGEL